MNTTGENYDIIEEGVEQHKTVTELMIQFWIEVYNFFKYIFYDVFRGVAP